MPINAWIIRGERQIIIVVALVARILFGEESLDFGLRHRIIITHCVVANNEARIKIREAGSINIIRAQAAEQECERNDGSKKT